MATFQITANGQTYEITAPNEQQALAGLQAMFGGQGQPQGPQMGSLEAFGRGAMRGFADLGRGAVGFMTGGRGLPGMTPDLPPEAMAEYAQVQQSNPIASALGESVPYVAGALATGGAMGPAGIGASMLGQGLTAGAIGASMPGTLGERAIRGGVDAATGMAGEAIGRAVGRMIAPQLFPANADRVIASAEKLGYKVLPSTRAQGGAGQPIANMIEGGLEVTPASSGVMARVAQHNQSTLNKEAVRALGENAEKFAGVSDEVLGAARKRIGSELDQLMPHDLRVNLDPLDLVSRIDNDVAPFLTGPEDPVGEVLDRVLRMANRDTNGTPADVLQYHISQLGKIATGKMQQNPALGHALMDVRSFLLDSVEGAMSQSERVAFRRAREQYRVLSALESGHTVNPASGDVSAAHLASFLSRRDKAGFLEGGNQSPLYEGVRFLGRLQRPKATSGTAERLMGASAVTAVPALAGATLSGEDDKAAGALGGAALGLTFAYGGAHGLLSKPLAGFFTRAPGAAERLATKMGGQITARMVLGDLPETVIGPLEETKWGKRFLGDSMSPDRMTPETLRRRLVLLTKGVKMTPKQQEAVAELQNMLKAYEEAK